MADLKISQLTGATTPLAGTEVLPVVQGSTTKQVSVANLTAGRAVSASTLTTTGAITSGSDVKVANGGFVYAATGAASGTVKAGIQFDGGGFLNFKIADTTVGVFSPTQLTISTGNIVPATAAKGINFTANTPAAGMTSQLLNWYEEGTWTPILSGWTVAGAATITGKFTRIGRLITVNAFISHATSTQCIAGTSYLRNLPYAPLDDSSCIGSSNNTDLGYGTGSISGGGAVGQIYPPSVTLGANQVFTVTGTYYV